MDSSSASKAKDTVLPFPPGGLSRIKKVLEKIPVCPSSWWQGVKEGRYPRPVKLGPKTTAWLNDDLNALIESLGQDCWKSAGADR